MTHGQQNFQHSHTRIPEVGSLRWQVYIHECRIIQVRTDMRTSSLSLQDRALLQVDNQCAFQGLSSLSKALRIPEYLHWMDPPLPQKSAEDFVSGFSCGPFTVSLHVMVQPSWLLPTVACFC